MPEWRDLEDDKTDTPTIDWDLIDSKDFDDTLLFGRQKK